VFVGLGYFMLILLAGLQTIPTELYDAAAIDGAGHFQAWRYITLPSLRPTFAFLLITGIVDAMARFSDLWTLGGPGGTPARSLQSVVMYMYQTAFEGGDMNYASAIAVVFFAIVLAINHRRLPVARHWRVPKTTHGRSGGARRRSRSGERGDGRMIGSGVRRRISDTRASRAGMERVRQGSTLLVLTLGAVVMLLPFWWMLATSLSRQPIRACHARRASGRRIRRSSITRWPRRTCRWSSTT
jgi:ABC-type glycerol-3-phosphate transport system permease component